MEHWKALSAAMFGWQKKISNSRRSRVAKTIIFWPWWQPFNSFCFETLSFLSLSPFFSFCYAKKWGLMEWECGELTCFHLTKITKYLEILDISKQMLTSWIHIHHPYLQQTANFVIKIFLLKFRLSLKRETGNRERGTGNEVNHFPRNFT